MHMTTIHLSSKGQIVIPKDIRSAHGWESGSEFLIIDTKEGLLLKPLKQFPNTTLSDLIGSANYKGKKKSLSEMEMAIANGVKKSK